MYAVEFETFTDGNVIHIPEKYRQLGSRNVKVIVMTEADDPHPQKNKDQLVLSQKEEKELLKIIEEDDFLTEEDALKEIGL